jgi:hypothetical protein
MKVVRPGPRIVGPQVDKATASNAKRLLVIVESIRLAGMEAPFPGVLEPDDSGRVHIRGNALQNGKREVFSAPSSKKPVSSVSRRLVVQPAPV